MRKSSLLDALFPRVRQDILATLLLHPDRRWSLSDLARHLHVTPSSLQRELASLTGAGILRREADGNRVYYQAEADYPLLPELQGLFVKTVGLADKVKAVLEPFWDEIELAFIYGSVARGERTAESDVDLLLVGTVGLAELARPLRELEKALQVPINVTRYAPEEYREKRQQGNHFLTTILSGSKIVLKGTPDELADAIGGSPRQNALHEQAGVG